jgi:phage gp29-like protein
MGKNINRFRRQQQQLAAKPLGTTTAPKISPTIAQKSIARTRQDIKNWNEALNNARKAEDPKFFPLQLLYNEIMIDALLKSQVQNRVNKSLAASFTMNDLKGNGNDEVTALLQNQKWVAAINEAIIESRFYGHSLIELNLVNGILNVTVLPRTNVDPVNGRFYPDYSEDKYIKYREMPEYGTWLLEFGKPGDLGILNSCVPHVLMKRFAQSCWSELCEIFGIPPRVMKTNTQDTGMLRRGERMMQDMGAAAWFIIDTSEDFEFAKGVNTNGDVYGNLIQLCDNQNSMVVSGAIIGQDTKNGNRSKDESAQNVLQDLVDSDLTLIEQEWATIVIPALQALGQLKGDLILAFDKAEDTAQLWKITEGLLRNYDIPPDWINEKFGVPVEPKKQPEQKPLGFNLSPDFFV